MYAMLRTINSNHAITIGITSLEESLCLCIGKYPGLGAKVLKEQPRERDINISLVSFECMQTNAPMHPDFYNACPRI
jgi:hypothetical protein